MCHLPNSSSTLLSPWSFLLLPNRAKAIPEAIVPINHCWDPAGKSSGLGPNFNLNGAVPFLRMLQGMWEGVVAARGPWSRSQCHRGGSRSSRAPMTLLEMTLSQLPTSPTHSV